MGFERYPNIHDPSPLFSFADDDIKPSDSLLDLAKRCGILLGHGEECVSAISASDDLAAAFNCNIGEPLLHLDRTVHALDAQAAEWRTAINVAPIRFSGT